MYCLSKIIDQSLLNAISQNYLFTCITRCHPFTQNMYFTKCGLKRCPLSIFKYIVPVITTRHACALHSTSGLELFGANSQYEIYLFLAVISILPEFFLYNIKEKHMFDWLLTKCLRKCASNWSRRWFPW